MSLLMDALRKAEEAKKKAAQDNMSEAAAPEKLQASAAVIKTSEDVSAPNIKLSMEEMEEFPKRSVVPSLEGRAEFEDEEDYVLPTLVGTAKETASDSDANLEQSSTTVDDARVEPEQNNPDAGKNIAASVDALKMDLADSLASPEPERQQEPKVAHEGFGFDSLEIEEDHVATREETAPATEALLGAKEPGKMQSTRMTMQVAEQATERTRDRDGPGRKMARSVFAAKKSPLLKNRNMKLAAGGALALVIVAFSTYFYISLNEGSTFNIPVGSYVAAEFADERVTSETGGDQLSIDVVTVAEVEEMEAINVAGSTSEQLLTSADVNAVAAGASAEPSLADSLIEFPAAEVRAVSDQRRSAANLQPESIAPQTPRPAEVVTPISDGAAVVVEAEFIAEIAQPVAGDDVQSTALVAPTNLISFRRQDSVAKIDPNVGLAYAAYQQGSLDQAEMLYRQTLASDPRQRDALLGLANIATRNGNPTEALDLYSRLLARNPSDPIARAGLMELLPAGSASQQEAELKRLLNEHPDVAALSYAYGNFLAQNQRWSQAQQAYFRALQLAKSDAAISGLVNPDYAFNLAVSLEHLNQSEPAQNYYREALEYSANHPAGFDLTAVRSRLADMAGNGNDE